ncbi:MAG: GlsB/YeaQ/YmgE family stress response membrane protein [Candidatus Saccharimonadales bacterium]|jgi:uncharacterized membrane protein YeaQ/YmgE (transglycosylase-associated protein family)
MAMFNILFWFIFGVLGGWTVALIVEPEAVPKRASGSGLVGAFGGMLGGALTQYISHQPIVAGFNGPSILVAVIVAVILSTIFNVFLGRHQLKS